MSYCVASFVNSLANVEERKYLELGVCCGTNLSSILCRHKFGVEINPDFDYKKMGLNVFSMSTDEYFATNEEKFDVIFIDANHQCDFVLRDFNNSAKCLNPGGLVFVHDLVPPTEEYVAGTCDGGYCGDGYKVLYYMNISGRNPHYTHDEDFGLTLFVNPSPITLPDEFNASYESFMVHLTGTKLYNHEEMVKIIKEL